MSSLEFVQGLVNGTLPLNTIAQKLDYDITEIESGRVVITAEPKETQLNPAGTVHGGFSATLLDSCMGLAILSTLEKGVGQTTLALAGTVPYVLLAMRLGIAFSWLNFRSVTSAYSSHCGVARRIRTSSPRGVRRTSRFAAKEGHHRSPHKRRLLPPRVPGTTPIRERVLLPLCQTRRISPLSSLSA
jgi:hypothetical protein